MSGSEDVVTETVGDPDESGPPPVDPERVGGLLSLLGKCVRAHQIYNASNPVYQKFVSAARESFVSLWADLDALELRVGEYGFDWAGRTFAVGEGRDSLPFLFFKDGIRYLTFTPGFEDEVVDFLEVVHKSRFVDEYGDDLITLLWEADLASLRAGYIDQLAETVALPEGGPGMVEGVPAAAVEEELAEIAPAPAAGQDAPPPPTGVIGISRDDFEETLFFLDPSELRNIQEELKREWERDVKQDVMNALFDRLEDPLPEQQDEILDILQQVLPLLLSRGDLESASNVILELQTMLRQGDVLGDDLAGHADRVLEELSQPEILDQLVRSIEDGVIDPGARELGIFLNYLRPRAIPTLVRATELTSMPALRDRLRGAIEGLARENAGEVIRLLEEEDSVVAAGAARLAGTLRLDGAIPGLTMLTMRPEAAVRLAAVDALVALRTSRAFEPLRRALEDGDRDVRIAAARGLGVMRYGPARATFEALVDGKALREADLTEKIAFFEGYAAVAGANGIELLDRLLNGRSLLGGRQPPEIRACAARGLGIVGTPAAAESLRRAADDRDALVRNAVQGALRQEAKP